MCIAFFPRAVEVQYLLDPMMMSFWKKQKKKKQGNGGGGEGRRSSERRLFWPCLQKALHCSTPRGV